MSPLLVETRRVALVQSSAVSSILIACLSQLTLAELPEDAPAPPTPKRVARDKILCCRCLRSLRAGRGSQAGRMMVCEKKKPGHSRCERCVKGNRAGATGCVPVRVCCDYCAVILLIAC